MHKKIFYHFLGLILALATSGTLALAQGNGGMGGGFQKRFFQIKRRQLGPELGVSQQTVDRLLKIEQRYHRLRQKLFRDSRADFQRLLKVMAQPSPRAPEVEAILSSIKRHQQEKQDLQLRQGDEEEQLLTPVQEARKIMYQRRLLREARSIKRRGGKPAPFTPPKGPREVQVSRRTVINKEAADTGQGAAASGSGQQTRLASALGVNQHKVAQLLQIRERYRPLRRQLIGEAKNEFQHLEQVLAQPHPANAQVKEILTKIKQKEREMQDLKQRQDEEEMAILTPVQQGRYLVFLIHLRHPMAQGSGKLGAPSVSEVGNKPARNAVPGRFLGAPPPRPPGYR